MMKKLLCTLILLITTVGFVQAQQEIDVQGNGISIIGDGTNVPAIADDTDFGQITPGTSSTEHIFTILNTGTAPLTIFVSATTDPIFSITTLQTSPVPSGSSTTIGVTYNAPLTPGITNAILLIFSNDVDESAYQINIRGESLAPAGPEMDVFGNGIPIAGDGTNIPATADGTNFGQITSGNSSTEQFYVIQNNGTAPLTVNPSFITDPSFVITTAAVSPVAPGGSTTIGVTFNAPLAFGITNATLFINNDDTTGGESPYQINLQAESVAAAGPEIDVLGNGISIIGDGSNTPNIADDTDFGQIAPLTSSVEHLFTIQNTGTAPLTVNPSFTTNNTAFVITTVAISPIPAGGSTTIGVTFTAPITPGIINAQLLIFNGDSDEGLYQINIRGESFITAFPEIDVLGNAISIIGDGTNVPNLIDGTDFGTVVASTSSTEQIFTIQNTGAAPLSVNPSNLTDPNFIISTAAVSPIAPGGSTTIGITFNAPIATGIYNATLIIANDDSDENPYQINIRAESIGAAGPEMDVFGLGIEIVDGDITPVITDDTDFGQADVTTGTVSHTFTIENNGGSDLNLTDPDPFVTLTGNVGDFSVNARPPFPILPGGSSDFVIEFNPTALGIRTVTVSIGNNDSDENPYTFVIQGEGIDLNADSPLMITQYYEGAGNDQWIEVKNISLNPIASGFYNLVQYTNTTTQINIISTTAPQPQNVVAISGTGPFGQLLAGEVVLFKNPSAAIPGAGNLGPAGLTATSTQVCTFTGNDVILISTSTGVNCYNDRIDIIGVVPPAGGSPPNWGTDTSFIEGCGTTEQPSLTFDVNDYIELLLEEVDNADPATNIALGTQNLGSTTWTTSWSNGTSDRTRIAFINGTYTAADGSFGACDLTISGDVDFNGGTSNYVEVSNSLVVSFGGSFTIGDQESLYTVNATNPFTDPVSIIGSISTFHTTTQMTDNNDYTYWSSPVENANMSSVFASPSYNQGRLYYWDQSVPNVNPGGGSEAFGEWIPAAGLTMTQGKGYISQGPVDGTYPGTATVNFSGRPTSGSVDLIGGNDVVFINDGDDANDLNLIGNPYPSAIDANAFILAGDNAASINGTLWFWSHRTPNNGNTTGEQYSNDDYASYNLTGGTSSASGSPTPTQYIGSGQGFMVQASSTVERISFTDAMRVKGLNTQFFRGVETKNSLAQEEDRVWLNLESSEGGAFSQILVGFIENATDGFDRAYDGIRIGGGWVNFYSKRDTLKYGIQGLSSFNLDKKVPLAFNTYIDDASVSYKISIDHIEGVLNDNDLYLVDQELNTIHDLKQGSYNFTVDATGSYDDRFTLQFTKSTLGIDELALDNNFVVINEENSLRLRSNTVITNIKIYDITGRLLVDDKPNNNEFSINTHKIGQGTVLILNATFENGAEVSKKAIKY